MKLDSLLLVYYTSLQSLDEARKITPTTKQYSHYSQHNQNKKKEQPHNVNLKSLDFLHCTLGYLVYLVWPNLTKMHRMKPRLPPSLIGSPNRVKLRHGNTIRQSTFVRYLALCFAAAVVLVSLNSWFTIELLPSSGHGTRIAELESELEVLPQGKIMTVASNLESTTGNVPVKQTITRAKRTLSQPTANTNLEVVSTKTETPETALEKGRAAKNLDISAVHKVTLSKGKAVTELESGSLDSSTSDEEDQTEDISIDAELESLDSNTDEEDQTEDISIDAELESLDSNTDDEDQTDENIKAGFDSVNANVENHIDGNGNESDHMESKRPNNHSKVSEIGDPNNHNKVVETDNFKTDQLLPSRKQNGTKHVKRNVRRRVALTPPPHHIYSKPMVVLFPMFGLCNRLRVIEDFYGISSCYERSYNTETIAPYDFKVFWYQYDKLNAKYEDLFSFQPFSMIDSWEGIYPLNSNGTNHRLQVVSKFERRESGKKPQHLELYSNLSMSDPRVEKVEGNMLHPNDLLQGKWGPRVVLASAWPRSTRKHMSYDWHLCMSRAKNAFLQRLEPVPSIREEVYKLYDKAKELTNTNIDLLIGIHIRTTDKVEQNKSSTSKAEDAISLMLNMLETEPGLVFYIAADNQRGLDKVKGAIPASRIIHSGDGYRTRGSSGGMAKAVVDLWMLSYCSRIWTTARLSVFPDHAVQLAAAKRHKRISRHTIRPANDTLPTDIH